MKIAKLVVLSSMLVFAFFYTGDRSAAMAQTNTATETNDSSNSSEITLKDLFNWRATAMPNYDRLLYDRLKKVNSRTVRIQGLTAIGISTLIFLSLILIFLLIRYSYKQQALLVSLSNQAILHSLPPGSTDIPASDTKIIRIKEPALPIMVEMLKDYLSNAERARISKLINNQDTLKQALQELQESISERSEGLDHERRILDVLAANLKASQKEVEKEST